MTADDVIPQSTLDTPLAQITGLVVGLIFLAAAIIAIIRIVRGPSILDRMIATDALLATIMCALGGLLAFTGRADLLPVMLVISMFGFVGAVGVSRYVSRADLRTTSRYRRMGREDHRTGSIGTVEGEPGVPESGTPPRGGAMILDVISALCIIGAALLSLAAGIGALRFPDLPRACTRRRSRTVRAGARHVRGGPPDAHWADLHDDPHRPVPAVHGSGRGPHDRPRGLSDEDLRRSCCTVTNWTTRSRAPTRATWRSGAARRRARRPRGTGRAADRTTHHDDEPDAGR